MIRNYSGILLLAIIAVTGLILAPAIYFLDSSTAKAATSGEGQPSSTTPVVLPLLQNGNTQNHFMIDKSQFKRSEEHTSELQSHVKLVCRLLLEQKNTPT